MNVGAETIRPVGAQGNVSLRLMRGFSLSARGTAVQLPLSTQRLVAFIALHDRPLMRLHVAGTLWLDVPEDRALANLRSALWRLRQRGLSVVDSIGDSLLLRRDVQLDIRNLASASQSSLSGAVAQAVTEIISAGELLPDWYDDWVLMERERLRQLRLHALERVSAELAAQQRYGDAIEAVLAAISDEPLRESSHRLLISVYLAEGNRLEAVRQFQTYARLMKTELGLEPAPEIAALLSRLGPSLPRPGRLRAAGGR